MKFIIAIAVIVISFQGCSQQNTFDFINPHKSESRLPGRLKQRLIPIISPNKTNRIIVESNYEKKYPISALVRLEHNYKSSIKKSDTLAVLHRQKLDAVSVDWHNDDSIIILCDTSLIFQKKDSVLGKNKDGIKVHYFQNDLEIKLSLESRKIRIREQSSEFDEALLAFVVYKNISDHNIELTRHPIFGHAFKGDNHIQSFNLNGEKVSIERDMHYQYFYTEYLDTVLLKPDSSKTDTILFGQYYFFNKKGTYNIRYVDTHCPTKFNAYSNWEEIHIK